MTKPIEKEPAEARTVAEIKRTPLIVKDPLAILDTGRFEAMSRVAAAMAGAKLVPGHLRGSTADCLLVVNQAVKRNMDPLDLAQHTFVVSGKLGYEGKVVAAWINASPELDGRLSYEYDGEDDARQVTVIGKLRGEKTTRTIDGTVGAWKTKNENWGKDPDQMLAYRGARQWARRHTPDLLLGVYTPDEIQEMAYGPEDAKDITPPRPTRATYQERVEAAKAGGPEDEAEDTYTLVSEVGEVIGEHGPAEFAAEFMKLYQNRNAKDQENFLANNVDEIDRLGQGPHAEGCHEPIMRLLDTAGDTGGEAAENTEVTSKPEAEKSAAPDPNRSEHFAETWKAPAWKAWSDQTLKDIDEFEEEQKLKDWYAETVDSIAKINMNASRNEWTRVNDAFNNKLTELQEAAP